MSFEQWSERRPELKQYYDQIDREKLKTAMNAVSALGDGTVVHYRQDFRVYLGTEDIKSLTDLYVTLTMKNQFVECRVHYFGGIPAPMHVWECVNYMLYQVAGEERKKKKAKL